MVDADAGQAQRPSERRAESETLAIALIRIVTIIFQFTPVANKVGSRHEEYPSADDQRDGSTGLLKSGVTNQHIAAGAKQHNDNASHEV